MTTTQEFFAQLKKDMENIMGQWDGDNPGIKEDRAGYAKDAIEKIDEVLEILEALSY